MNWTILTLHAVRLQVAQWLKRRENRLKFKKKKWLNSTKLEHHKSEQGVTELKRERRTPSILQTLKTQQQMLKSLAA